MKSYFIKQANLNARANKIIRDTMKNFSTDDLLIETPYGTLLKLTTHLNTAVNHWFDFFDKKFNIPWRENEINYQNWNEILKLWEQTDERFKNIVNNFGNDEEFEQFFTYSHNKRDIYKMKFSEMFLHLTCHSYYHRGQLVMFFRQNGLKISPPVDADDFFKIKL